MHGQSSRAQATVRRVGVALGYSSTLYSVTRLLGYSVTRLLGYSVTRLLGSTRRSGRHASGPDHSRDTPQSGKGPCRLPLIRGEKSALARQSLTYLWRERGRLPNRSLDLPANSTAFSTHRRSSVRILCRGFSPVSDTKLIRASPVRSVPFPPSPNRRRLWALALHHWLSLGSPIPLGNSHGPLS
jgi:hypothetical protein